MASAALDLLLQRVMMFIIQGESYGLCSHRKVYTFSTPHEPAVGTHPD